MNNPYLKIKKNDEIFYIKFTTRKYSGEMFLSIYKPIKLFGIPIKKKLVYTQSIDNMIKFNSQREDLYVMCVDNVFQHYFTKPLNEIQKEKLKEYCKTTINK